MPRFTTFINSGAISGGTQNAILGAAGVLSLATSMAAIWAITYMLTSEHLSISKQGQCLDRNEPHNETFVGQTVVAPVAGSGSSFIAFQVPNPSMIP